MIDYDYIEQTIKPDLKELKRKKEHTESQIQIFEDFLHNYHIELRQVNNKINQLENIIEQLKTPSN